MLFRNIIFWGAVLLAGGPAYAASEEQTLHAPALSSDRDYAEYWEQQFYFDTGALLTSQFMITNLPLSRHHGLMVASLKLPGAAPVIIKNGRKRDGWAYDSQSPHLSIFQHQLQGGHPGYLMRLHNTAAEADLLFNASARPIVLMAPDNPYGLPSVTLYAPGARGVARWRPGPEIGGPGQSGGWHSLGDGTGYGLHVVQDRPLGTVLRRWRRLVPLSADGIFSPTIHLFDSPGGGQLMEAVLLPRFGEPERLSQPSKTQESEGSVWTLSGPRLNGTIELIEQLEAFEAADQLNAVEQLVAGSLANISRSRYRASYDLEIQTTDGTPLRLTGTALIEDIIIAEDRKKRRRRR